MSALVIDSSAWVSYFDGRGEVEVDSALEEGRVIIPPIVAAELLSGRLPARQRAEMESFLADLPVFEADLGHWFRVGRLRAELRARGISVSTPDAHVGQCAMDLGALLLSEDRIFRLMAKHAPLRLFEP